MTQPSDLDGIPGGRALIDWFSGVHHFHDAELRAFSLSPEGTALMRIATFRMTDPVDAKGFFILDRHVWVSIARSQVVQIQCEDIDMIPAILHGLQISRPEGPVRIEWDTSIGMSGCVTARQAHMTLVPG